VNYVAYVSYIALLWSSYQRRTCFFDRVDGLLHNLGFASGLGVGTHGW
jgi:hypothetical protein